MTNLQSNRSVVLSIAQRKVIADLFPELMTPLALDQKNAKTIAFTTDKLVAIREKSVDALLKPSNGMVRHSLRLVAEIVDKALEDSQGIGSQPVAERLYQFKITISGSDPMIWRRIQIKRCTLDKLHEHIQTVFGWENSHLHQFNIDGNFYGDPELLLEGFEDDPDIVDSRVTSVDDVVPKSGKRFRFKYLYDFGDDWEHEILFEGCLRVEKGQRYPLCLEGARACPPEDVGGIAGYVDYLEALADPNHDQHEEMMDWRGPFDPELFHPELTTRRMRRGLPDWRSMK